MKSISGIFSLTIVMTALISCGGSSSDKREGVTDDTRCFFMGVAPIWKNFKETSDSETVKTNILDMLGKISAAGELVTAQEPWRDNSGTSGTIPSLISLIGGQENAYGYKPLYGINFFTQSGNYDAILSVPANSVNDWSNVEARDLYRQTALAICTAYNPKYLALGLEVNSYYLKHSNDFVRFVSFYKKLYDEIKTIYPDTMVFVTFQLEMMKGIGDTTWGTAVDPHWELIDTFDGKLDLIVFTSYPEVEYATPGSIPDDYYTEIRKHVSKPVAFSEIGWSSTRNNEYDQSQFIDLTLPRMNELKPVFVNWIFMHDPDTGGPLNQTGLRNYDGSAKLAWSTWCGYKARKYTP